MTPFLPSNLHIMSKDCLLRATNCNREMKNEEPIISKICIKDLKKKQNQKIFTTCTDKLN